MKILHCADLHLGRRPIGGRGLYSDKRYQDYFDAFYRIIDTAVEKKADVLLIAGDMFDRRELSPEVLEKAETALERLKSEGIHVLLTEGNHDNISTGREEESWLVFLEKKGYITRPGWRTTEDGYGFTPVEIDGVRFYGAGYPGAFADEVLTALAETLDPVQKNIVLVHTAFGDGDFIPGTCSTDSLKLFQGKVMYMAGGHIHSHKSYPKKDPYFFIPGAPEYWDLGESGKRGSILFDTETGNHSFLSAKPRRRLELSLETTENSESAFRQDFSALLENIDIEYEEDLIIIRIIQNYSFFIDTSWCEEAAVDAGALKAVIQVAYPHEESLPDDTGRLSIEQVEEELIGTWPVFAAEKKETARRLRRLKDLQSERNFDVFFEEFDSLLEAHVDREGDGA